MESLTGGCYWQPSPGGLCSSHTQQSSSTAGHDNNHLSLAPSAGDKSSTHRPREQESYISYL